jgi:hypothetical protein
VNIKERITETKRRHLMQKVALTKRHGQQLMELYNTCDHEFSDWTIDQRRTFLTVFEIRICSKCNYVESRTVK